MPAERLVLLEPAGRRKGAAPNTSLRRLRTSRGYPAYFHPFDCDDPDVVGLVVVGFIVLAFRMSPLSSSA